MTSGGRKKERSPASSLYHTTIKEWPEGERPREKLLQGGPSVLSEAELLAVIIRTGAKGVTAVDLAKNLLADGRTLQDLACMAPGDFRALGIGPARAVAIVAAFELMRRIPLSGGEQRPLFRSPEDVAKRYSAKFRDLRHEEFWVLILNTANRLTQEAKVSSGTLNSSLVHSRECFREAIKNNAASVIFLHNHPSGNPEPSQEDITITRQLVEAGKILGIPVHDHIILAGNGFTSLAERGLV